MSLEDRLNPYRDKLPISQFKKDILYLLEKQRILIIVGETGSGKSTQIPQIIFSAGIYNENAGQSGIKNRLIGITQPRRVAAMQLAQRVSQDLNCDLGSTVGYAIRFKDVTNVDETMIKFLTEGLLVKEMLFDPLLTKYSVIMVDEAHERNLNTDILLALLRCVLMKRDDLRLIVCSATLNVDEISRFLTCAEKQLEPAVLRVPGKTHPLKIYYLKDPVANYLDASVETAINIHETNRLASGKILIFLTGQEEIEYVCEKLRNYAQAVSSRLELKKFFVLPLHASLKPEEISKVFDHYGRQTRVCIVSTNVAETSLTIDDVAFVVDCGFTKLKLFDHMTGMDSLKIVPTSKSSAKQRAGRAGRTREGMVYRLYPEAEYEKLDENTVPEIQRSSLAETIILLKSLGVGDLKRFPMIAPMPDKYLVVALELLHALQAIGESGELTNIGEMMAQFNLDPKVAKILVSQEASLCTIEVCKIAAMIQVKEIYVKSGKHSGNLWSNTSLTNICTSEGDLPSYLNIFNGFINNDKSHKWADKRSLNYQALLHAVDIAAKIESQVKRCGIKLISCESNLMTIQKAITSGLFPNAAYLHPCGDYKTVRGDQTVFIHPTSVFNQVVERPKHVVFVEILNTTKAYMRHIMSIEPDWLLHVAPSFYTFATNLEMSRTKQYI